MTDATDGFRLGKRFLIHDRDPRFTVAFGETLADAGVRVPCLCIPESQRLRVSENWSKSAYMAPRAPVRLELKILAPIEDSATLYGAPMSDLRQP